jgi:hypothetical protein
MSVAEPSKPSTSPVGKPGELPRPDQLGALPKDVMNWEKKGLDGSRAVPHPPRVASGQGS